MLPKFYRYLIYRLYIYALKNKNSTPWWSVIITLTFIHYLHFLTLYMTVRYFFPLQVTLDLKNKWLAISIMFILLGLTCLIAKKERTWVTYIQEFESETISEKTLGTWKVTLFIGGSILLFFILLPILY